jgi:hypothetical protein
MSLFGFKIATILAHKVPGPFAQASDQDPEQSLRGGEGDSGKDLSFGTFASRMNNS